MKLNYDEFLKQSRIKFDGKCWPIFGPGVWKWSVNKLPFVCSEHGKFFRTPCEFLASRYGCNQCAIMARAKSNKNNAHAIKLSFEQHIQDFREIHKDTFEYPPQSFQNSHSIITIICKIHGEFLQHIHAHKLGRGCPICNKRIKKPKPIKKSKEEHLAELIQFNKSRTTTREAFLDKCQIKHGNKFEYDLDNFENLNSLIKITCNKHGRFIMKAKDHLVSSHGCQPCSKSGISYKEILWLDSHNIIDRQYKIMIDNKLSKVDGFDPIINSVYEFLGDYWHGNPNRKNWENGINSNNKFSFKELFEQTEYRFNQILLLGYSIFYLWEFDYDHKLTTIRKFNGSLEWQ